MWQPPAGRAPTTPTRNLRKTSLWQVEAWVDSSTIGRGDALRVETTVAVLIDTVLGGVWRRCELRVRPFVTCRRDRFSSCQS